MEEGPPSFVRLEEREERRRISRPARDLRLSPEERDSSPLMDPSAVREGAVKEGEMGPSLRSRERERREDMLSLWAMPELLW